MIRSRCTLPYNSPHRESRFQLPTARTCSTLQVVPYRLQAADSAGPFPHSVQLEPEMETGVSCFVSALPARHFTLDRAPSGDNAE
ncbi:hypothetical protein CEP52_004671 [Fusarium oligoseptatum]|uniref:Uncharacterized protein n=1 Tax=Fusarium oligoseptatum TaxID=2604345 RepID=A0A428U2A9_9HYPO|nr:hypothetical protein CEP52_004671 [Fusarium oligoseptatum]